MLDSGFPQEVSHQEVPGEQGFFAAKLQLWGEAVVLDQHAQVDAPCLKDLVAVDAWESIRARGSWAIVYDPAVKLLGVLFMSHLSHFGVRGIDDVRVID